MYLVLGDQEGEGHMVTDQIILQSNASVMVVQKAYKDSCRLTGVAFHKGTDFTGKGVSTQQESPYLVACNDGDDLLSKAAYDILVTHGLTIHMLMDWDEDSREGERFLEDMESGYALYTQSFVHLWVWFTSLSLPKGAVLLYQPRNAGIPKINACEEDKLNVQFGYGLM